MKKKIFLTYIINVVISVSYIMKGLSKIIKSNKHVSEKLQKITSTEISSDFGEIINFIVNFLDKVQNVVNSVKLYVYGYPPLFVGIIALALSSIGTFLLTKKLTETSVGYYVTVVYSYLLLGLLIIIYFIIHISISRITG